MTTLVRLAWRDLRHQRGFAALFVVNLALGLTGAVALDALQASVERTLGARSRSFLAADLRVGGNRAVSPDERADIARRVQPHATSDLTQLYSMATGEGGAQLAEVRAIDDAFPLFGRIVLARSGEVAVEHREGLRAGHAWVDKSLLASLGISVGDELTLGASRFEVADTIERDTGLSVRAASLAPRIYVAAERLAATGLVQTGSRVEYQHLLALAPGDDARAAAVTLRRAIEDPRLRIASHDELSEELSRGYERVLRYLGLVSLVALSLAGVACAYLFRAFLRRRLADVAIIVSLGARVRRAQALLVVELLMLALPAALLAVALASLALPLVSAVLGDLLPAETSLYVGLGEALTALVVAALVAPAVCLPFLARLAALRVVELFQEHAGLSLERRAGEALWYLPAACALFSLAAWRSGSLIEGTAFVVGVAVAFVAAAACGRVVLAGVSSLGRGRSVAVRLALRHLEPRRRGALTAFVALSLSALLVALPAELRVLLDAELDPPSEEDIPSLFLFDIQPEQTEALAELVAGAGVSFQRLSPMIRARLDSINDAAIGGGARGPRSLDRRDAEALRSRRYNLTYQPALYDTEALVSGEPFSGAFDPSSGEAPEVSMEVDFARRLGVVVGDRLRFDVQGVPVDGRVVNLRSVDWTSMQPNFFVSFQPGVLEGAPAVFLGSVPALDSDRRDRLQADIVVAFPNVSMIDVRRGVERILALLDQLQWAIAATAWMSLAVGLALVFAIARDEALARRWEINLMKVLGARHALVLRSVAIEFAVLGLVSAAAGGALGAAATWAVAEMLLDVDASLAWSPLLSVVAVFPLLAATTAALAMRPVLEERPRAALA